MAMACKPNRFPPKRSHIKHAGVKEVLPPKTGRARQVAVAEAHADLAVLFYPHVVRAFAPFLDGMRKVLETDVYEEAEFRGVWDVGLKIGGRWDAVAYALIRQRVLECRADGSTEGDRERLLEELSFQLVDGTVDCWLQFLLLTTYGEGALDAADLDGRMLPRGSDILLTQLVPDQECSLRRTLGAILRAVRETLPPGRRLPECAVKVLNSKGLTVVNEVDLELTFS
jgi:hypothetical protein